MTTQAQDNPAQGFRLEDFLPYRLVVVTDRVSRVFAGRFAEGLNLTLPEWRVLAAVAEHAVASPTAVAAYTAMDKVKVSRAAQSLIGKGLLRQGHDPRDGRGRLLRLTRKGSTTHSAAVPMARNVAESLFDGLTRADIAALNRALGKITTRIETMDDGANPEDC